MSEKIADIVAEMRREVGDGTDTYCGKRIIRSMEDDRVRQYCDRIEAAWERDREDIELNVTRITRNECRAEYAKDVGNAAAMREAMELVLRFLQWMYAQEGESAVISRVRIGDEIDRVISVLSAPPRNCDIAQDWLQDLYCNFEPPATVRREMPPEWVDAVMVFCK